MPIFISVWIEVPSKTVDLLLENSVFKFWWRFVDMVEEVVQCPAVFWCCIVMCLLKLWFLVMSDGPGPTCCNPTLEQHPTAMYQVILVRGAFLKSQP